MIHTKHRYYIYILTNFSKTILYTGVTNNLQQRIVEHYSNRNNIKTFAGKYKAYYLIFFEVHQYITNAIAREKEIKGWSRQKKIDLIKSFNSEMKFLNDEVFEKWPPDDMSPRG